MPAELEDRNLRFRLKIEVENSRGRELLEFESPGNRKDRQRCESDMPPREGLRRCNGCGLEMVTANGSHHVRIAGAKLYCGYFRLIDQGSRAVRGGVTGESDG